MKKVIYPNLEGKVAIVTGAARGIGKAISLALGAQGVKLVIDDLPIRQELLEQTKKEADDLGYTVSNILADVRNEKQVQSIIDLALTNHGQIDILVNNAGIVFDTDWNTKTVEQWRETLETNLIAPYLTTKAAETELTKTKGCVINIASTNAYKAMSPFSLEYDASKAGLITLTHNTASALAPGVRVNAVAPGWVNTEMNSDLQKEIIDEETSKIFQKRFADPEEIASVVVFLASEEAQYINGTTVTVDGGYQ